MIRLLLTVAALALFASTASAQAITQWTARVYLAGAQVPLQGPVVFLAINVTCGLPPDLSVLTDNPTRFRWTDPLSATSECEWKDPGTGILSSTPFGGNYEATLTATNAFGTTLESNRAPFTHPGGLPVVPSGFKARR